MPFEADARIVLKALQGYYEQSIAGEHPAIHQRPMDDRVFTGPILEAFGMGEEFALVLSGDSLPRKKPDPLPLLHAAEHFGATPARSVLIGDSVIDVQAARNAGFTVVCVSYGYNDGRDIREANPDAVIDSLAELSDLFEA